MFEIIGDKFYLNGKPFIIRSGAIHYFRVPREYWKDRLEKLKACGLNTVETYVSWNLHEKKFGEYDFTDMLNIPCTVCIDPELTSIVGAGKLLSNTEMLKQILSQQ